MSALRLTSSAFRAARRTPVTSIAKRSFGGSIARRSKWDPQPGEKPGKLVPFDEIRSEEDLLPPGAKPGTVPTDLEQATGLERLEILGKMQGIDIFDMRPLDSSRMGTLDDPIIVPVLAGDEQYAGCTGHPPDSHVVMWLRMTRKDPVERCPECGNVIKCNWLAPEPHDDHHGHHHGHEEPKTFADYVRPEYRYR